MQARSTELAASAVTYEGEPSLRAGREDREDLANSFRSLSKWLARRLNGLTGRSSSDVDDVVQESFLRFGRYEVDARNRHPKALLLRIAFSVNQDRHRRAKARGEDWYTSLEDADDRAMAHETDPELLIDLKRAIVGLPSPLRETFLLARFTPMTNDEIARHLGVSTKTVEWRISRAVRCCLQRLDRERGSR